MYPAKFIYELPESVDEALELLYKNGEDARPLAGGMSLVPLMKLRLVQPKYVIDISRLKELKGVEKAGNKVVIGAATTNSEIEEAEWLLSEFPIIRDTVHLIGDVQVRNLGTIGGNISDGDPSLDWLPTLIALEAEIVLRGKKGERTVPAGQFLIEPYTTVLASDELVTSIRIPLPEGRASGGHVKIERRTGDFAVAIAASQLNFDSSGNCLKARIAVGAVSPVPFRSPGAEEALIGHRLSPETINRAAEKSVTDASDLEMLSDVKATSEYRRAMIPVIVRRSLLRATSIPGKEGNNDE